MRTWLAVLGVIAVVAVAGVGGYMIGQDASEKSSAGDGNTGEGGDAGGDSGQIPENAFRWNIVFDRAYNVFAVGYYSPTDVTLSLGYMGSQVGDWQNIIAGEGSYWGYLRNDIRVEMDDDLKFYTKTDGIVTEYPSVYDPSIEVEIDYSIFV